jgi:small GTP-binding protein
MREELAQLRSMTVKLRQGRVDIVVFGEINAGKSSVVNALLGQYVHDVSVQGGKTTAARPSAWGGTGYQVQGYADSFVSIVDTPGISEVNGEERAQLAQAAADTADLILFVVSGDMKANEFNALRELSSKRKPLILVLNKIDLYSEGERRELHALLRERSAGVLDPHDVVLVAANPRAREVEIESADGSWRTEQRQPAPQMDALKSRILEVLERDGKGLVAINAAMFASDRHDKVAATRIRLREEAAEAWIWRYAAVKAVAVAANPIPGLDIAGALSADLTMVIHLAAIYGVPLNRETALDLATSIAKASGVMVGVEWLIHGASGLLKTLTFGLSTALTAVPQGAAAGYGSLIIGKATKYYLEHNASWGAEGPKTVVRRILDEMSKDKQSVIKRLEDAIRERLQRNTHARGDAG